MNFLTELPELVLVIILTKLKSMDINNLKCTCRSLYDFIKMASRKKLIEKIRESINGPKIQIIKPKVVCYNNFL